MTDLIGVVQAAIQNSGVSVISGGQELRMKGSRKKMADVRIVRRDLQDSQSLFPSPLSYTFRLKEDRIESIVGPNPQSLQIQSPEWVTAHTVQELFFKEGYIKFHGFNPDSERGNSYVVYKKVKVFEMPQNISEKDLASLVKSYNYFWGHETLDTKTLRERLDKGHLYLVCYLGNRPLSMLQTSTVNIDESRIIPTPSYQNSHIAAAFQASTLGPRTFQEFVHSLDQAPNGNMLVLGDITTDPNYWSSGAGAASAIVLFALDNILGDKRMEQLSNVRFVQTFTPVNTVPRFFESVNPNSIESIISYIDSNVLITPASGAQAFHTKIGSFLSGDYKRDARPNHKDPHVGTTFYLVPGYEDALRNKISSFRQRKSVIS